MINRSVRHATAKMLKNSFLHAAFSARVAMVKRSSLLPQTQHAVGAPPPVVQPAVNNEKNN
jgi:prolyl-tRNA editing enzyme YbaK/EbsC (Cys-tRNA(Pro) deacylase)